MRTSQGASYNNAAPAHQNSLKPYMAPSGSVSHPLSGSSSKFMDSNGVYANENAVLNRYSSGVPDPNTMTNTYGNGSNRLLQNFLTESGLSPTTSNGGGRLLDNAKDEPSIASGMSENRQMDDLRTHDHFLRQTHSPYTEHDLNMATAPPAMRQEHNGFAVYKPQSQN